MSADSKVPNFPNFLFLLVGISCLTNLFPQIEDALTLKEHILRQGQVKSLCENNRRADIRRAVCRLISAERRAYACHVCGILAVYAVDFGTFIPQLYNAIAG